MEAATKITVTGKFTVIVYNHYMVTILFVFLTARPSRDEGQMNLRLTFFFFRRNSHITVLGH